MTPRINFLPLLVPATLLLLLPGTAAAQTTTLTGAVIDSVTSRPLGGVELYTPGKNGTTSSGNGVFRLKNVPVGQSLFLVRRVGYVPLAFTVEVSDSAAPEVEIGTLRLKPLALVLSAIVVESTQVAVNPRLADFYRRKKGGVGYYLTQDQIWKKNPLLTSDLLRDVAGVQLQCGNSGGCVPVSTRGNGYASFTGRSCPMQVVLDGMPSSMTLDEIPPGWIAGIEIYRGIAFTPMELSRSPCGVVAVWTGSDLSVQAQLMDAR